MKYKLSTLIAQAEITVAPGIFDALGALLVKQGGFQQAYLSGASIAYTRFGRPDIGLVGLTEVAEVLSNILETVDLPLLVDADTGFGNALNVRRTVRLLERNGAAAIQLEDQVFPKRCGHLAGKSLVSESEMTGKLKAALDARHDSGTLIIARTDALAGEGLEKTLQRAAAYVETGIDILFVEAPANHDEMLAIVQHFKGQVPLMANMVEGGRSPAMNASELQALGFSLVIFPGGLVRAFACMAQEYLQNLKQQGSNAGFRQRMLNFDQLNILLDTQSELARGQYYEANGSDYEGESGND